MKCFVRLNALPGLMRAGLANGDVRARNATLRQLALVGLERVDGGVDLRTHAMQLCGGEKGGEVTTLLLPDESPLAQGVRRLESSMAAGRGAILFQLAVLGWELSGQPAREVSEVAKQSTGDESAATVGVDRTIQKLDSSEGDLPAPLEPDSV